MPSWKMLIVYSVYSLIAYSSYGQSSPPPMPETCRRRGFTRAPLILINFDGMSPLYVQKNNFFMGLTRAGVSAEYMRPVYPTKTFPNLYTMVTGLYPESHGIVDNRFKDPNSDLEFKYNDESTHNRIQWGGEPIWVTAKKNGLRTSVRHWPGSQQSFNGIGPDAYSKPGRTSYTKNLETAFNLLKLPERERPQFITIYFNEPDHTVHQTGPTDPKVGQAVNKVTALVNRFMGVLNSSKILDCINIIFVSDHGGTRASCDTIVYLDQIANLGHVAFLPGPSVMVEKYKSEYSPEQLFEKMRCPKTPSPIYDVFKKKDMPRRHHYSNNPRIGDLVIKMRQPLNMFRYKKRPPPCEKYKGNHGYDDGIPSMQGIFYAYGVHFKKGQKVLPFQNIELYNLMAALLGIEPAPNNGTYGSLADAVNVNYEPRPPALRSVNYHDYRGNVKMGAGSPLPIDEGYESDVGGFDYNKRFKREDEQLLGNARRAKRQDDDKEPFSDDYYGNAPINDVQPHEDVKSEKERQHKESLGSRFLDLFRRKQTPPPPRTQETDEDLKILYGPGSPPVDDLPGTQLPNAGSTQPIRIVGDNKCCQPQNGGQSSTPQSSVSPSTQNIVSQSSPFGIPKSSLSDVTILPEKDYVIGYDTANNYPLYVSYLVNSDYPKQANTGCIKMDPRLSSQSSLDMCHQQSNLVDNNGNKLMPLKLFNGIGDSSNVLSNVVYVYQDFYNNIWAEVLRTMNEVAKKRGAVVILGPIFDHDGNSLRDDISRVPSYVNGKRVLIPSHFFIMSLYCRGSQGTNCPARNVVINAFVIPHTKQTENCEPVAQYIRKNYARVKDIELLTGLNFFLKYPESDRIKLTNHFYLNLDKN